MLKNFFISAFRNLFRQKTYSLLNLLGLSLGIACILLLTIHVKEELSYEKNFPKHDRLFRVVSNEWSKSSMPIAGELMKYFPEISSAARFSQAGDVVFHTPDGKKSEGTGYFADSSAVQIFDFKSVSGDPLHALSDPTAIVITRSFAQRFFGDKNPIGQKLIANDKYESWVAAVIEDLPSNTHLHFDYLLPMPLFYTFISPKMMYERSWMFGWTYIQLRQPEDVQKVRARLKDFMLAFRSDLNKTKALADAASERLQPITDIHLRSNLIQEMGPNGSILYIYIFIAIGILILLIACVNFVNLFTTQSLKRIKEVAVRKVMGASRSQLVLQFLGEAFILTILSGLLAALLYRLALPFYNDLTGKQLSANVLLLPSNLRLIITILFFTGLLSGLFPALFISGFQPASSLKANQKPGSSVTLLRKSLVVFQFVAAGFLIISTLLVYRQTTFLRDKQLGFDKEQVALIKYYGDLKEKLQVHPELLKNEFLSNPDILAVGQSSNIIGDDLSVENITHLNPAPGEENSGYRVFRVDENYLTVMNITLKDGRNFSPDFHDSASFIINETAAKELKLKNPVGTIIRNNSDNLTGTIIGVVKDFHFASLHNGIEPLVLQYAPRNTGYLLVKIRAGKIPRTITFLKEKVAKISPNELFTYGFLDERIAGLYRKEDNMSTILKVFSVFSILISCLGLFGLAAYAAEIRTREIGIRKVIGASTTGLVRLLTADFMIPVLIGNIIAWPFAWWAANSWLREFTYRVDIGWIVFVLSLALTGIVALFTIGFRCWHAASVPPIKSLRSE